MKIQYQKKRSKKKAIRKKHTTKKMLSLSNKKAYNENEIEKQEEKIIDSIRELDKKLGFIGSEKDNEPRFLRRVKIF